MVPAEPVFDSEKDAEGMAPPAPVVEDAEEGSMGFGDDTLEMRLFLEDSRGLVDDTTGSGRGGVGVGVDVAVAEAVVAVAVVVKTSGVVAAAEFWLWACCICWYTSNSSICLRSSLRVRP